MNTVNYGGCVDFDNTSDRIQVSGTYQVKVLSLSTPNQNQYIGG